MNGSADLRRKGLLFVLVVFAVLSNSWVLNERNGLVFDDTSTISQAMFQSYDAIFRILPIHSYNDRPIGTLFIKVLTDTFGVNAVAFHWVFFLLHLVNVYLVYRLCQRLFDLRKVFLSYPFAALAAGIFGIFASSLMAVSWVSAIFDLLCCTFVLLSLNFYLESHRTINYRGFYRVLVVFFYFLSLRTKEMSLTLPILIWLFEIGRAVQRGKRIEINKTLVVLSVLMFAYLGLLLYHRQPMAPDNPYYQVANPLVWLIDLFHYLALYVDPGNSGFGYSTFHFGSVPGLLVLFAVGVLGIYSVFRWRDYSLLLLILAFGASIAVVLPMVNTQHRLYLYIPSVFIGLAAAYSLWLAVQLMKTEMSIELVTLLIPVLFLFCLTPGIEGYRNSWLALGEAALQQSKQIEGIDKPQLGSHIYIKGASAGYNIFYYGPGDINRILYRDGSLKTELVSSFPESLVEPYNLWEYSDGKVNEILRSGGSDFEIEATYPDEIVIDEKKKASDLELSVICTQINPSLVISVNGADLRTIVGDNLLTTVVPFQLLAGSEVAVVVKDVQRKVVTAKKTLQIERK